MNRPEGQEKTMHTSQRQTFEELPASVREALDRGQLIEAIKRLRSERNIDLKDARDLIRQHQNQRRRPGGVHAAAKQAELDAMIREDRSSPMLLIVLVLIAIGFAVYWFVR
jgi:hypothetical protein